MYTVHVFTNTMYDTLRSIFSERSSDTITLRKLILIMRVAAGAAAAARQDFPAAVDSAERAAAAALRVHHVVPLQTRGLCAALLSDDLHSRTPPHHVSYFAHSVLLF